MKDSNDYKSYINSLWREQLDNNYPLSIPLYKGKNHNENLYKDEEVYSGLYFIKNNLAKELESYFRRFFTDYEVLDYKFILEDIYTTEYRDARNLIQNFHVKYRFENKAGIKIDNHDDILLSYPMIDDDYAFLIDGNRYSITDELIRKFEVKLTYTSDTESSLRINTKSLGLDEIVNVRIDLISLELSKIDPSFNNRKIVRFLFDPYNPESRTKEFYLDRIPDEIYGSIDYEHMKNLIKGYFYLDLDPDIKVGFTQLFELIESKSVNSDDIRFKRMISSYNTYFEMLKDDIRYSYFHTRKVGKTKLLTFSYKTIKNKLFTSGGILFYISDLNPVAKLSSFRRLRLNGKHGPDRTNLAMRDYQLSYKGIIDPVETPESGDLGLLIHRGIGSCYDMDGNLKRTEIDSDYNSFNFSAAIIPFIQNCDSIRVSMASNHIKQSLPLLDNEVPFVSTGMDRIIYKLMSKNQSHNLTNDRVIDDGNIFTSHVFKDGYLTLGREVLVGWMPYKGLNYEDGIVISESLANNLYSMKGYRLDFYTTDKLINKIEYPKVGDIVEKNQILATYYPRIKNSSKVYQTEYKMIRYSKPGKVTRVIYLLDDIEVQNVDDPSKFKFNRIIIEISSPHRIEVADKISFSSAGKGTISKILPDDEMPRLPDGRILDVLYNTLGIPSRMNLNQLLEASLGEFNVDFRKYILSKINSKDKLIEVFKKINSIINSENMEEFIDFIKKNDFDKLIHSLRDRLVFEVKQFDRTVNFDTIYKLFEIFDLLKVYDPNKGYRVFIPSLNKETRMGVFVGYMRILVLKHMVEEKKSSVSIEGISDSRERCQKLGEMEFLGLETYGSSNFINEVALIKNNPTLGTKILRGILESNNGLIRLSEYKNSNKAFEEFSDYMRAIRLKVVKNK